MTRYTPSEALDSLIANLPKASADVQVIFPADAYALMLIGLAHLGRMVSAMEAELGAFRALEAARFAKGEMEEVARDAHGRLILDDDGKVLRPDFGRRT